MRNLRLTLLLLVALPLSAQDIDLSSIDALGAKAENVVSVNLGPELLEFAKAFLSSENPEEAAALQITDGLEGIQVRVFEFDQEGDYLPSDLDAIKQQLSRDGWTRVVEVNDDNDQVGVWMFMQAGASQQNSVVDGMVVLVEEPDEIVFVNIVGSINPSDLAALGALGNLEDLGDLLDLNELGEVLGEGAPAEPDNGTNEDD
jgi:hypothetical protein